MGNGQYKHGSQRHKSHPNIASLHRKASTSKWPAAKYLCNAIDRAPIVFGVRITWPLFQYANWN